MNPKIAALILMLLALSWPSAGTDSFYLGNGTRHQIINLDAGAKLLDQNVQFTRSGFTASSMPQPMALSSNMMIAQARKLMDEAGEARNESISARDEAKSTNDEVKALLEKIEENEKNTAQASQSQNRTYLLHNETAVIFSQSMAVYNNMTQLEKDVQTNSDNIRTWMNETMP